MCNKRSMSPKALCSKWNIPFLIAALLTATIASIRQWLCCLCLSFFFGKCLWNFFSLCGPRSPSSFNYTAVNWGSVTAQLMKGGSEAILVGITHEFRFLYFLLQFKMILSETAVLWLIICSVCLDNFSKHIIFNISFWDIRDKEMLFFN